MDLTRLLNSAKRLMKAFQNVEYACNENAPALSKEQYSAISVGAVNAEQNQYYCNCLETEPDKQDVVNRLSDYYGIVDRESAISTLDWLLYRGHHVYFEAIRPVISNSEDEFDIDVLLENEKDRSLIEYVSNIKAALETLVDEQVVHGASEFKTLSVAAWDLGRLVLVSRCCYDAQYISEDEAWQYIMSAYAKSKELYSNWREFAKGYIVGRAMWKGNDYSLSGLISITECLLKDDKSPWMKYPLS